jgi:hypothetical protein
MTLKQHVDANAQVVAAGGACSADDRALLSEFSARLYETDTIKRMRIE